MSSLSTIPDLATSLASASPTASSPADQITQALQALLADIKSGDTKGATTALGQLQTAFAASNPTSTVTAKSLQVKGDLATMSQALASGSSSAINSAFLTLQKDLTSPTLSAASTKSTLTPAYVLSLLSTLPDANADSTAPTTDVGSTILSALSAQQTASTTAKLNLYA